MEIREGKIEDSPFIARVVMEAVGEELILGLAQNVEGINRVKELFTNLAADSCSQYSYRNALIATDESGAKIGGVISYDGALLHELRRSFFREANRILGWKISPDEVETWEDEADAGEIYIDSLYVSPEFRNRGIASLLVKAIEERYESSDKPLGLLVEPSNEKALNAYLHWGFKEVGISNFFQTPMKHMQKIKHK